MIGHIIYAASWLVFAMMHSLLARQAVQVKIEPFLGRYYRLVYNLVAAFKLSVVLYIGRVWLDDTHFGVMDSDVVSWFTFSVRTLGIVVLVVSVMMYDVGRFAGITQVMTGERVSSSNHEPLQRRFLNRWMRHPLYTGAFLVLWGGAVSTLDVSTAVWGSVYLLIGTAFEERKLVRIYGDEYRSYQREVPRYFPFSRQQAV